MTNVTKLNPKVPVTPRPDARGVLIPTAEEFAAWCAHPITRFVASAMQQAAEQQRDAWFARSWGDGQADPLALIELRTRADAYMAFLETGLEQYAALLET